MPTHTSTTETGKEAGTQLAKTIKEIAAEVAGVGLVVGVGLSILGGQLVIKGLRNWFPKPQSKK